VLFVDTFIRLWQQRGAAVDGEPGVMRQRVLPVMAVIAGIASSGLTAPARASLIITPTFGESIATLPIDDSADPTSPTVGQVEASVTEAITAIDSLYGNVGSVPVLFEYGSGGGGATTNSARYPMSYDDYVGALTAASVANPANATLATAVAHLPADATLEAEFGTVPNVAVSATLANVVLGQLTLSQSVCFNGSQQFVAGCGQQYAAVVTLSAPTASAGLVANYYATPGAGLNSTAVSVVEHELDEVLGGGGAGSTLPGSAFSIGPLDLYRYASTGSGCTTATGLTSTLSRTTSLGAVACYSIDGGATAFAQFNQAGGGSDYGDFAEPDPSIQDAYVPAFPADAYSATSPEYVMMQSVGYDAATPEPPATGLFVGAVLGLGWFRSRRPLVRVTAG
jgi:hypothetical protein